MAVSSTTGGLRTGVCLSTDRPDNPYNGQVVYETDTNRTLVWDNSAWVVVSDPALVSYSGTGVTVTADAMTVGGENVTPYTGRRNLLYNGAMQVAQRGTSFSVGSSETYTLDRWKSASASSSAVVQKSTSAPSGFRSSLKYSVSTGMPSSNETFVSQVLEGQDLQMIGYGTDDCKQLSLSFWVLSNVTGTYNVWFHRPNSSKHIARSYTVSSSGSWQYKTLIVPADVISVVDNDNTAGLEVRFYLAASSSYTSGTESSEWSSVSDDNRAPGNVNINSSPNSYWQITGVQLELGDKATPFEHRSFGEELALCQRYFEKSSNYEDAVGNSMGTSVFTVGSTYTDGWQATMNIPFKVNKRSAPSMSLYGTSGASSGWIVYNYSGTAYNAVGTFALNANQHNFRILVSTWNGSSGTLNFTNGLSYPAVGAWTASAEL